MVSSSMTNRSNAIETMLISWTQNSHGRYIKLLLPDDESLEPFKSMRVGRVNGQRLGIAFALIGEDESSHKIDIEESTQEILEKAHKDIERITKIKTVDLGPKLKREMTLPQRIGMLCNDEEFFKYIKNRDDWPEYANKNPTDYILSDLENCKRFVRDFCGVSSRSEIQYDTPAQKKWADLVNDYRDWLKS